ncbi:Guanine nucleotide-binding protein alpha-7 subunit [Trichinella pseudospiralis]|uniref:Guanine nucleotide-binding protein alpha-3 subunit n=1 Tax=Trichinella pseudospiralis TaxID=6337 RepID=A0A0V1ISQ8_TRIPS|nr:Guanine nucleotide-binding protein alpha-7 subunit [Trichinella pseudospiralis]
MIESLNEFKSFQRDTVGFHSEFHSRHFCNCTHSQAVIFTAFKKTDVMGHCASREDKEARKRNKKIEDQMRKDQSVTLRTIKLLLLGAGESGKSTILKQMKILHKDGFSQHDFEMIRPVVYSNTVHAMLAVLRAMYQLNIEFSDPERQKDAQIVYATVHAQRDAEPFSESLSQAMQKLWADGGVQSCYSRSNEYQIDDSAKYFLDDLPRLSTADFLPNEQDVLRTRVKTTGITEVLFELKGLTFRVIDVGGQRSERKKWIHCFDNVNAIIFISSLSEYDQTMREDNFTNRMHESLKLFDSICNSPWFVDIHFILFLNKKDLFAQKIRRSPLTVCFPEYKGQQNYSESVNYIQWKFEQLNRNAQREIYCHHTCATDTNNVQFVLDACLDMIIAKNLKSMGLC